MIRSSRTDKTKDHVYVKDRLGAYLDDELTARERRAVEQHLKTCEACRWDLATLKQTVTWLAELPTVPVPRVFAIPANVVPAPPVRRPRWSLVPAMQLATALVAVLLFFAAAGDVMLTGWPWATARPQAVQEIAMEPAPADMPLAKEIEPTWEGEVGALTAPYGTGDGVGPAGAAPAAIVPTQAPAPEREAAGGVPSEEITMAPQVTEPEAAARSLPTEPAGGMGGGEQAVDQEPVSEGAVGVETDTRPVERPAAPEAAATRTPIVEIPVTEPTVVPTLPLATTEAPTMALAATTIPTVAESIVREVPEAPPVDMAPANEAIEPAAELAQAPEPLMAEQAYDEAESLVPAATETNWAVFGLRALEYVLGVTLVVLAGATIVLMVWRRRASSR